MTRPKFSVGDSCIVCAPKSQIYNHVVNILGVLSFDDAVKRRKTICNKFTGYKCKPQFVYLIDVIYIPLGDTGYPTDMIGESALRKKHTPGKGFDELMVELNKPNIKQLEK